MKGTITRFLSERHFGFIRCETDAQEYFFHELDVSPEVPRPILRGQHVSFELSTFKSRVKACKIKSADTEIESPPSNSEPSAPKSAIDIQKLLKHPAVLAALERAARETLDMNEVRP